MKTFIAVVSIIVLIGLGLFLSDPVNRLMLSNADGEANSGNVLGVEIGMDAQKARKRLTSIGFRLSSPPQNGSCLGHRVAGSQSVHLFLTNDWRGGVICVFAENGETKLIAWGFSPVSF